MAGSIFGRGIVELFEAIPGRIEVAGTGPTWRVTGGSFEAVVDYVGDAFDEPVVLAREDRSRWWPRVTLTVTTDPELAAAAPPLDELTDPREPEPEFVPRHRADPVEASFLDEIFARQEHRHDLTAVGVLGQRRRGRQAS